MSDWNEERDDDNWDSDGWDDPADGEPVTAGGDEPDVGGPSPDTPDPRALLGITAGAIGLVIGAFAIGTASAIVLIVAIQALGVAILENDLMLTVISTATLQGVGMLGISLWYLSRRGYGLEFLRLRMPTLRHIGLVVVGVFGTFAASIGVQSALTLLGYDGGEHEIVQTATGSPEILLALIPLSFLLIGPGEELLFRGIIQSRFVNRSGVPLGIVLASLLFAVVHIPAYGGLDSLPTIVGLFFISLVLGGLYEYTENLFVPIVVHGAFNAIQFAGLYFVLTSDADVALLLWPF
ncbi:CPBP family intramembrane glutamic endopeptidase [Natronoarchaeum sp. GCM10025321]|uniref:CPBP family intramembrane glutamic endopeptidase n=2 Tax=unclassified Natronoarchaeum TaxID=2620183 RepID=UPI003619C057